MNKNYRLDASEQDIEDNFEKLKSIDNQDAEINLIYNASLKHSKCKKPITLRVQETDLEVMRVKASKLGIPYQTYINMLIHKDAISNL
jgi:predicted DNA binding CopG/RHH family protein